MILVIEYLFELHEFAENLKSRIMATYENIIWKDEYFVNIASIDEHHRKFLDVMNALVDALNLENCVEKTPEIFFRLTFYIESYLINEEMLMKQYSYPKFSSHKESHNQFVEQVSQFQAKKTHNREVCAELLDFLTDWFENHLLHSDKEAVAFLLEKGAK